MRAKSKRQVPSILIQPCQQYFRYSIFSLLLRTSLVDQILSTTRQFSISTILLPPIRLLFPQLSAFLQDLPTHTQQAFQPSRHNAMASILPKTASTQWLALEARFITTTIIDVALKSRISLPLRCGMPTLWHFTHRASPMQAQVCVVQHDLGVV